MDEERPVFADDLWEEMAPLMNGKSGIRRATGRNSRRFRGAVADGPAQKCLGVTYAGEFGKWKTVFRRFRWRSEAGIFTVLVNAWNSRP